MTPGMKWAPLALTIGIITACSNAPLYSVEDRALRAVQTGVIKGFEASEAETSYHISIRYNPVDCDVPPFEAYTHERWNRVYVQTPRELVEILENFKTRSATTHHFYFLHVEGAYSGTRRAQSGVRYPVFSATALHEP